MVSLGDTPPFRAGDRSRGIAYQSVFLVLFNVTLFIMGGFKLIQSDYSECVLEKTIEVEEKSLNGSSTLSQTKDPAHHDPTAAGCETLGDNTKESGYIDTHVVLEPSKWQVWRERIAGLLGLIFAPPNLAVILGIIVALVPIFKTQFVRTTRPAPEPALEFVFAYIYSVGAAYVPLALVNLGAALARMDFVAVPFGVSLLFALTKLVLTPAIGISFVLLLVRVAKIIDADDKPLIFLAMFASCVPTATTIMVLTQFYSPDGEAKEIASILIVQYALG
ncbi:hypothetical protein K493DRAFT_406491, partial [Basidiobolus meristosporus CBS 931.73]